MNNDCQEPGASFHTAVQPHRDLESNWAVDLAKNLEEYLVKICSGEITGRDDTHLSVNFAEAALLLQGSIQVYSRKVEYLYSLVLHALEFISQKRSQDPEESPSKAQTEASSSRASGNEDNDQFWCPDDIPVETKNSLDSANSHAPLNHFVKPPANLVVLEGECFDAVSDVGELESYLLATSNLYRDFILLDPCDAAAVDGYLKGDRADEGQATTYKGSSRAPKTFQSPTMRSGGTARKSSHKKKLDNTGPNVPVGSGSENHDDFGPAPCGVSDSGNGGYEMNDHHSEPEDMNCDIDDDDDYDDEDDPWKPLNPHEPGNLKVKPFRKVKISRRHGPAKQKSTNVDFPLAKLHGPISPELIHLWEMHIRARQKQESYTPPFYEKLRESLLHGGNVSNEDFFHPGDDNDDDDGLNDFQQPDFDMPDATYMDEDASFPQEQHEDFVHQYGGIDAMGPEEPSSQASLEDLCRAHLDSLLASIAETEKQTELATRVATWKQNIEHNLEEQDSRPPFDIHEYGDKIIDRLDKLSLEENEKISSFTDVVRGQEKHEVARSFSALLQLVNEGKVGLDRSTTAGSGTFCHTSEDPFYLQLLTGDREPVKVQQERPLSGDREPEKVPRKRPPSIEREPERVQQKKSKKKQKSPVRRRNKKGEGSQREQHSVVTSPTSVSKGTAQNNNIPLSLRIGKPGIVRCTPESKRRRQTRFVEPGNLHHAG